MDYIRNLESKSRWEYPVLAFKTEQSKAISAASWAENLADFSLGGCKTPSLKTFQALPQVPMATWGKAPHSRGLRSPI